MNDKEHGSLFADWNRDLRERYIQILDLIIRNLKETPYYPFTITDMDALKLREAAKAMGVELDDYNLYDRTTFFEMRGEVIKRAVEKVEEYLRPGNPLEEALEKEKEKYKDLDFGDEI